MSHTFCSLIDADTLITSAQLISQFHLQAYIFHNVTLQFKNQYSFYAALEIKSVKCADGLTEEPTAHYDITDGKQDILNFPISS